MHEQELYWDATFAIVMALQLHHPDLFPDNIGLQELASLVGALPGFKDDPNVVTDQMLLDILTVWIEEDSV